MPVLYCPLSGQSVSLSQGMVKEFLQKGYTETPPILSVDEPEKVVVEAVSADPAISQYTKLTGELNINTATLKQIAALGMPTVTARRVRDKRPYKSVSELIAIAPDVPWLTLTDKINCEVPDAPDPEGTATSV